jgi:hypothetical protein
MTFKDPSIEDCAKVIASEAWDVIDSQVRAGANFYRARETVLAVNAGRWAKLYGKACMTRAIQIVEGMDPSDPLCFTKETVAARTRPADDQDDIEDVLIWCYCFACVPTTWLAIAVFVFGSGGAYAFAFACLAVSALAATAGYCQVPNRRFKV